MKIIQGPTLFSQSLLWELQRTAYQKYGPSAWSQEGVPSYLTSNPRTAWQYVQVIQGYVRDLQNQQKHDPNEPIYIFDLGAGTGRLGYLIVQELARCQNFPFCYVMTDIVWENIRFWENHPYWQRWIAEGIVDFCYFEHNQEAMELLLAKKILKLTNPCVLVANYFFDTVPQSLYRVQEGMVLDGYVELAAPSEFADGDPRVIPHFECRYSYRERELSESGSVEAVLSAYKTFEGVSFLLPTGGFQTLDFFAALSQKRFLLLAADQGVATEEQVRSWGEPRIARHGTFSVPVSYHALALYFSQQEGKACLPTFPDAAFVEMAGVLGMDECPETERAFRGQIDAFEPKDYWHLINQIEEMGQKPSLEMIFLLIKLGRWDPIALHSYYAVVQDKLAAASDKIKKEYGLMVENVLQHFYPISNEEADFILNLGVLQYLLKDYVKAREYFELAGSLGADQGHVRKNLQALKNASFE